MNASRTIRSYTMHLDASPEAVFPLLCPKREYEWIEPWQCEIVYSDSGLAELDGIFTTRFPDDGPEDTWVVSRYEPPTRIEFVRVNALRAMRYSISLKPDGDGKTEAIWKQVATGLTPEGNEFVSRSSDEAYRQKMQAIEIMLNHFLKTRDMIPLGQVLEKIETES